MLMLGPACQRHSRIRKSAPTRPPAPENDARAAARRPRLESAAGRKVLVSKCAARHVSATASPPVNASTLSLSRGGGAQPEVPVARTWGDILGEEVSWHDEDRHLESAEPVPPGRRVRKSRRRRRLPGEAGGPGTDDQRAAPR